MFGFNKHQLKNGILLAFILFLFTQLWQELIEEDYEDNLATESSYQELSEKSFKTHGQEAPRSALRNYKEKKRKPGIQRKQRLKAGLAANEDLKKKKEDLERERDLLQKLLWEANIKNIMSGQDALSPLIQSLPKVYAQDDPELIQIIKQKYLIPPSDGDYNIHAEQDTSMGQAQTVRKILNNKHDGHFIECGALDGETRSNSLFLEMENDWQGILIEADPISLAKIRSKNRKAWLVPACLSTKKETMYVTFAAFGHVGHILDEADNHEVNSKQNQLVNVTCLPLYSILMALDNPSIDYFSLDVEGSELDILKTIPFDSVDIKTLSVEFFHLDEKGATNDEMKTYMISQGYKYHSTVTAQKNHANDYIFVHKSV